MQIKISQSFNLRNITEQETSKCHIDLDSSDFVSVSLNNLSHFHNGMFQKEFILFHK